MPDPFETLTPGLEAPASNAVTVAPDDAADLLITSRALYVGTGGDVRVTLAGGDTVTFVNVQDASILPLRVTRVLATGTDASDIVAVW